MVAIRDPAYAYMLLSSGVRRPGSSFRRHRAAGPISVGYAPPGEPIRQPTVEEIQELHSQAAETHRLFAARVRDMEKRHGDVLRRTAADLVRIGTATLRTSVGDIQARIIPFPKEAVVLEIQYAGGGRIQARSSQFFVGEQAIHQLADALASIRPDAEPLA